MVLWNTTDVNTNDSLDVHTAISSRQHGCMQLSKDAALVITWIETAAIILLNSVLIGLLFIGKRNRMSFFVLHLALADLSVGVIYTFPQALQREGTTWNMNEIGCQMYTFITHLVAFGSSWMLAIISLDRLHVILKPMPLTSRKRYRYLMVSSAWILSVLFAIPQTVSTTIINGQCRSRYWGNQRQIDRAIKTFTVIGFSLLPAAVIAVCFTWIAIKLRNRRKKFQGISWFKRSFGRSDDEPCSASDHHGNHKSARKDNSMNVAVVKSIQMCFVVISVFVICWSPFCIFVLLTFYRAIDPSKTSCAFIIVMSLAPLNSVANPIVFFIFNKNLFGKKLKNIFGSKGNTKSNRMMLTCVTSTDSARAMREQNNGQEKYDNKQ